MLKVTCRPTTADKTKYFDLKPECLAKQKIPMLSRVSVLPQERWEERKGKKHFPLFPLPPKSLILRPVTWAY